MNDVESLRRDAVNRGQIGVHPLGTHDPEWPLVSGNQAMVDLALDLKKFGSGDKERQRKACKVATDAYAKTVQAALGLHPQARMANTAEGYDPSLRSDGFYRSFEGYSMSHTVYVPFLPGGHMVIMLDLSGDLSDLEIGSDVFTSYFPGDDVGTDADSSEHNERNLECKLVIEQYLEDVLNHAS